MKSDEFTSMISIEMVKTIIKKRKREIHKGDCGRILIVAGSDGMMGAAILAAKSALKSGAGLVQLAISEKLFPIAQVAIPEATCLKRPLSNIQLDNYDAVAVGPGLGQTQDSVEAVKEVIEKYKGLLVLDADGLNIVAKNNFYGILRSRAGETIITPHMGEAKRLLEGADFGDVTKAMSNILETPGSGDVSTARTFEEISRLDLALALKKITGSTVVLKGAGTIVATSGGKTYINTTGNPGMATAGSGDVLTGILVGLAGQKMNSAFETGHGELPGLDRIAGGRLPVADVAKAGVFIHGLAGDLAAEELGEYGVMAGDIAANVPYAIRHILE